MYVRDFSDLPSAWQESQTHSDFWPLVTLIGGCILVALLAAILVPQFATIMASAIVT